VEKLYDQLKVQISEQLNLKETGVVLTPEMSLFSPEGAGLDSIDALELIVLLQKHYNIQIQKPEEGKKIFQNIQTIAQYIQMVKTETS